MSESPSDVGAVCEADVRIKLDLCTVPHKLGGVKDYFAKWYKKEIRRRRTPGRRPEKPGRRSQ